MAKKITLEIVHQDHDKVILTNKNGDTFTYNPLVHEEFDTFLTQF